MNEQYFCRGIRGAISVNLNSEEEINAATIKLLDAIIQKNNIEKELISSVFFTLTDDLNATFPAKIARITYKWDDIPMLCFYELAVPNSLPMCIRILLTVNTKLAQNEIKHIYLEEAKKLRPDLSC